MKKIMLFLVLITCSCVVFPRDVHLGPYYDVPHTYEAFIGAIIGAVAGLAGLFIANSMSKSNTASAQKAQYEYNSQLQKQQADLQNQQYAYQMQNGAVMQKQALLRAGYNPSFQAGTAGIANTGVGSGMSVPFNDISGSLPGMLSSISQLMLQDTQQKNLQSQTNKNDKETGYLAAQTHYVNSQTQLNLFENEVLQPLQAQQIGQEISESQSRVGLNESQKQLNQQKSYLTQEETNLCKAKFTETLQHIDNLKSEKKFTDKQIDYLAVQTRELYSRIALNIANAHQAEASAKNQLAQANYYGEQAKYTSVFADSAYEQGQYYKSSTKELDLSNDLREFENGVKMSFGEDYYKAWDFVDRVTNTAGDIVESVSRLRTGAAASKNASTNERRVKSQPKSVRITGNMKFQR